MGGGAPTHIVIGRDAHELRGERPGIPHHTLKLLELARPDGAPALTPGALRAHVADRLARVDRLEPLRWRPEGIGRGRLLPMVWVVVDVELDEHLDHVALGEGGAPSTRDGLLARALETPIDRRRPLWRLTLVDEPDGGQSLVLAIHHALGGGLECAALIEALLGPEVVGSPPVPAGPAPDGRALVALTGRRLAHLARRVPATVAAIGADRRRRGADVPVEVKPFDAPLAPWHRGLAGRRRVGSTGLPLADVVRAGRQRGATVNDVLLTLVGGALADLQRRDGGAVDGPLTAAVPVHRGRPGATSGNQCTTVGLDLVGWEPDPVVRLDQVAARSRAAKARHLRSSPIAPFAADELGSLHATAVGVGLLVGRILRRPTFTTIVSLVRAPAAPLAVGRSVVARITSYGMVTADLGCNVTAWSSADRLEVGITGCAALDVAALIAGIEEGCAALVAAVEAAGPAEPGLHRPPEPVVADA